MATNGLDEYWVPEHVKDYLRKLGFVLPLDDMEPWIRSWDDWMSARGDFYDYRDKDGMGRVYAVHRRSIHPAMRVCKEWGSLLLNEEVKVVCDNQEATDWINSFCSSTNFMNSAQATVVRAFGLGTGAWALWIDLGKRKVRIRNYDARMVIPLSWDEDGITECAFVTRAFYRGKAVDQLQMFLVDIDGNDVSPEAVAAAMRSAVMSLPLNKPVTMWSILADAITEVGVFETSTPLLKTYLGPLIEEGLVERVEKLTPKTRRPKTSFSGPKILVYRAR